MKIVIALIATVLIFFFSLIVIQPIIMHLGYSAVEGSYHAATHAFLVSLIFTVIVCTLLILDEIKNIKYTNVKGEENSISDD